MTIYLDRGPFLTIPDKLHPGQHKVIRNPEWHGELPEIVSFTDFLKWNYTLEYGRPIRELNYYQQLPLPAFRRMPRLKLSSSRTADMTASTTIPLICM